MAHLLEGVKAAQADLTGGTQVKLTANLAKATACTPKGPVNSPVVSAPSPPTKPLSWSQKQSQKDVVTKPSFKGTRVTELHFAVPKGGPFAPFTTATGVALKVALETLLSHFIPTTVIPKFNANPIIAARWSTNNNLVVCFHQAVTPSMSDALITALKAQVKKDTPVPMDTAQIEGLPTTSPEDKVRILNKPPTAMLKFLSVSTLHPNSSTVTPEDLLQDIQSHPAWEHVPLWSPPKFLVQRGDDLQPAHVVVVSVVDDTQGSVSKALMQTMVRFSGSGGHTCFRWVPMSQVPMCNICQQWGHHGSRCKTNRLVCEKCRGPHLVKVHTHTCKACKSGWGDTCQPSCANCGSTHSTTNRACPFWEERFNYSGISDLVKKRRDELITAHGPAAQNNKGHCPWGPGSRNRGAMAAPIIVKGTTTTGCTTTIGYKRPTPPNGLQGPIPPPQPSKVQTTFHFTNTFAAITAEGIVPPPPSDPIRAYIDGMLDIQDKIKEFTEDNGAAGLQDSYIDPSPAPAGPSGIPPHHA
jgi:hypothetical protein